MRKIEKATDYEWWLTTTDRGGGRNVLKLKAGRPGANHAILHFEQIIQMHGDLVVDNVQV